MNKYFKIDRNSREIIIDKHKSYNVNVDILDLIIDLQLERDKYKNIINELENFIKTYSIPEFTLKEPHRLFMETKIILDKLQELKEGK